MKTIAVSLVWAVTLATVNFAATSRAETVTNQPGNSVRAEASKVVTSKSVYSLRFTGGTAAGFFDFLRTNGFAQDTIVLADKSGEVRLPAFTLNKVGLKEIGRSLEVVSEGELKVEVVEAGEGGASDVNVWRISFGAEARSVKTRACAMPYLLGSQTGRERVAVIVESVHQAMVQEIQARGRNEHRILRGQAHTLAEDKIVVVIGTEMYVEAVALALEAAERVAAVQWSKLHP
jgi:hypothetical protein